MSQEELNHVLLIAGEAGLFADCRSILSVTLLARAREITLHPLLGWDAWLDYAGFVHLEGPSLGRHGLGDIVFHIKGTK